MFISGLCSGLIAMIKFNMLGFHIGFCLVIGIDCLRKKEIKKLMKKAFFFLLGMGIPCVIFLTYLIINHAFSEFVEAYITYNTGSYTNKMPFIKRILLDFYLFFKQLLRDKILGTLITIGIFYFIFNKKIIKLKLQKCMFLITFILSVFGLFYGGFAYDYYFLIMVPYSILGLICIFKNITIKQHKMVLIITLAICLFMLNSSKNITFAKVKKEQLVQYKYAKIINKDKNPTILNYGWLDGGFYMMSDILPNARYFELQNGWVDDYDLEIEKQVKNSEFDYIIQSKPIPEFQTPDYIKENYILIRKDTQKFESMDCEYYLWKKKGEK